MCNNDDNFKKNNVQRKGRQSPSSPGDLLMLSVSGLGLWLWLCALWPFSSGSDYYSGPGVLVVVCF